MAFWRAYAPASKWNNPSTAALQGLDELRGIAAIWVCLTHGTALWNWLPFKFAGFGMHGVILFFFISGFLITKILLKAKEMEHPHFFSTFYVRRLFRIWPLMLLALYASATIFPETAQLWPYNITFLNNYYFAYTGEAMHRTDVMWSLAVEEHFYIFWPVLVYVLPRKWLPHACVLIIAIGFSFEKGLIHKPDYNMLRTTHGTMQYIAMGALLAFGPRLPRTFWVAIAGVIGWWFAAQKGSLTGRMEAYRYYYDSLTAFLYALAYAALYVPQLRIRSRILGHLGVLCYEIYLVHFFMNWAMLEYFKSSTWWTGGVYLLLTYTISVILFYGFSQPVQHLRVYAERSARVRYVVFGVLLIGVGHGLTKVVRYDKLLPLMFG